jgi:NCS1 family nucleobase:cation symporter-1|uniref:Uncharacterized protein n=1 Tax=Thermomicrobium roseum TaxID=500 RepID=A0A7C1FQD6_THERO
MAESREQAVQREVYFGILPVLRGERQFGLLDFLLVQVGFGIAAWSFLVGGYTGSVLPAGPAIAAILFGNAIPVFLISVLAILYARYGVDTFIGARAILGPRGSNLFLIIFAILNLGWITIACFMLGESAIRVVAAFGGPEWLASRTVGAPIFALAAFAIAWWLALQGPIAIRLFIRVGVPAMVAIIVGLIIYIFLQNGVSAVWNAQPPAPYDTPVRGLASAIEWNVGLGFSWLPYIGQWNRLAKDERTALIGTYLGWGVLLNVAAILGALTALLVGTYEPTEWMIQAGGPLFGLFGLFMLILANLTSATVLIYSQGLSIKTLFPRWKWLWALLTTVPAALLMLTPTMYDSYTKFLAYISFIMAAFGGVMVADYVFIQRFHISLRDLYRQHAGRYQYFAGFNWEAYAAVILGGIFYFWTYDPATDRAGPLFTYITAGIPTFFLTAAVYLALTFVTRRLAVRQEEPVAIERGD